MNHPPRDWIVPSWPVPATVRALSSTRSGGVSAGPYASFNVGTAVGDDPARVTANRQRLGAILPAEPCWLKQVHGTRVVDAARLDPGEVPEADAAFTTERGVVLAIQTADCLPVLLAQRDGRVIAAAHAGWRGLAGGVIEVALDAMKVPAAEVVAWLGPAIGPQSYEVGEAVRQAFLAQDAQAAGAFVAQPTGGKYLMDLYALARLRLASAGVASVHGGGLCTLRDAQRFYSFRRDGITGRMVTLLWLAA